MKDFENTRQLFRISHNFVYPKDLVRFNPHDSKDGQKVKVEAVGRNWMIAFGYIETPLNLTEISNDLNLSRERVRGIFKETIYRIRQRCPEEIQQQFPISELGLRKRPTKPVTTSSQIAEQLKMGNSLADSFQKLGLPPTNKFNGSLKLKGIDITKAKQFIEQLESPGISNADVRDIMDGIFYQDYQNLIALGKIISLSELVRVAGFVPNNRTLGCLALDLDESVAVEIVSRPYHPIQNCYYVLTAQQEQGIRAVTEILKR